MASSLSYRPRCPEQGALHQIVREHYETFRAQVAEHRDGQGLRSAGCRHERLVAFSCKGRGFCPSCGGRRMTERAAHLVDYVFPDVPMRQWVLTLPSRVRYAVAWNALCRAVVAVFVRVVLGWYRRHARRRGIDDGRGGAVVIVQRFGSALNLNVHLHALVLDGVFVRETDGALRFHAAPADPAPDPRPLVVTIAIRLRRLLTRRGVVDGGDALDLDAWDPFADDAPTLAGLAAASVRGVAALGPRAGRPVRRWGTDAFGHRSAAVPRP